MKTLLALALVIVAIASYFVLALGFGVFQLYPVVHYVLAIAGCAWLAFLVRRQPGWRRGLALVCGLVLTGFYLWYTLSYSTYENRAHRVAEGEVVAMLSDLHLTDQDGETATVLAADARATLLVFYRGFW